ncbi:MAG: DMT family transporter [Verrucomicrobiota bacterium]
MSQGDLYAILAGLFWALSVILLRISTFRIRTEALTLFKSAVASVCFIILILVVGEPLVRELPMRDYLLLIASAFLGITIADTLFTAALSRLGASLQAIADCVYSPAMIGVGYLMFREVLGVWEWAGGALVVAGVAVGMTKTAEVKSRKDLIVGVVLAVSAHVIMAVGILMVRDLLRDHSVVWISGFRFAVASLALVPLALIRLKPRDAFAGFTMLDTWKVTIPMSILGPCIATICWTAGFKFLSAGRAAIYNQMATVFIIVLAVVFLKESFTKRKALGAGLSIAGAVLVSLQKIL